MSEVDSTNLLTLANQTAILADSALVMTRGGRLISSRGTISIRDITPGDGPWMCGVMSKALTLALLTGFLENAGPVSPTEISKMEIATRGSRIRTIGVLTPVGDGSVAALYMDNHGLSGLRFAEESAGWNWWLYNLGKAMTTGASWNVAAQSFVEFEPSG